MPCIFILVSESSVTQSSLADNAYACCTLVSSAVIRIPRMVGTYLGTPLPLAIECSRNLFLCLERRLYAPFERTLRSSPAAINLLT